MMSNTLPRATVLAAIVAALMSSAAVAQTAPSPGADDTDSQDQNEQSAPPGMMGRNMMRPGMMGGMPMMGSRGHMMKIMFAVADVDGDGALSFEEITTIHKRIFDKVDANKDGKVTPDEVQAFMRP